MHFNYKLNRPTAVTHTGEHNTIYVIKVVFVVSASGVNSLSGVYGGWKSVAGFEAQSVNKII